MREAFRRLAGEFESTVLSCRFDILGVMRLNKVGSDSNEDRYAIDLFVLAIDCTTEFEVTPDFRLDPSCRTYIHARRSSSFSSLCVLC